MSCQARQGKEAYQMAILTISNREAEGAGEAVGGGEADVALAGEEAGDDDLGDAGFLADLIDGFGAFFDGGSQGVAEATWFRFSGFQWWKLRHDFLSAILFAGGFCGGEWRRADNAFELFAVHGSSVQFGFIARSYAP
jgi:hypothetical protein